MNIKTLCKILAALVVSPIAAGAQGGQYNVPNNTPGFIAKAVNQGPVDPAAVISVNVWLKLHNQQQLDKLVEQQKQKSSGNYQRWITQDQFNGSYAPTAQEVNAISNFLSAHNLSVVSVAENNLYVKAQGTAADLQKAFHVQINNYTLNGASYRSNTSDPSVDNSSNGLVAAVTGLDDFGFQPKFVRPVNAEGLPAPMTPIASGPKGLFFDPQCFRPVETDTFTAATTIGIYSGNRYGSDISSGFGHFPPCGYQPSEVQTAYNLIPLYVQGLTGSGETIVITDAYGSPTIAQDAQAFSSIYGLPPINLTIAKAPGLSHNPKDAGWDGETTLDVEWAHAIAPGAKIVLVVATDRASLDEAINYAVVHHLGNTISNSWDSLEGFGNPAQLDRVNRILEMAAAQGIDVNFASGDNGDEILNAGFQTVDFPASSPFATGVGGTSLGLNPDNTIAFQTGWGNNLTKIAGTNATGNPPVNPPLALGFQFGAGGGASLTFARPSFQSGLSVPGTTRLVPDIAMLADPFTGVEIIETVNGELSVGVIGGTSLASPLFSGIMAIAAQKAGHGLGQAAALVYALPAGAITDIVATSSPGNVTGTINATAYTADQLAAPLGNTTAYYSAIYNSPFSTNWFVITFGTDTSLTTAPGWDNVTGLGTPNGLNFVNAIAP
jgi:subtilase family serine protease